MMITQRVPRGGAIRFGGRWFTVLDYAPDDDGTPAYWVEKDGRRVIVLSCFVEDVQS